MYIFTSNDNYPYKCIVSFFSCFKFIFGMFLRVRILISINYFSEFSLSCGNTKLFTDLQYYKEVISIAANYLKNTVLTYLLPEKRLDLIKSNPIAHTFTCWTIIAQSV